MAKVKGFSAGDWDASHGKRAEGYAQAIEALYNQAADEFAKLVSKLKLDPEKPFSFKDHPTIYASVQRVISQLAVRMQTVITSGSKEEWLYACKKNDAFLESILNTSQLSKEKLSQMKDNNLDALKAFQERKVDGKDLSKRVWKYTDQFKSNIELSIDGALAEGISAQTLSKEVKQYLKYPDKLFRRVRDKHGNLKLSQRAKDFHPGQGVYRSSHQNAMRLTRSEINMAYRTSEQKRWARLDFVVGYEIRLSNNHTLNGKPFKDICDQLLGKYPKWFVFKGWHPQCRCSAIAILMDPDEFNTDELNELKAALKGTEYKKYVSRNLVHDVPQNFKDWITANAQRSKNWSSQPYFIRDNFNNGTIAGGLRIVPQPPKPVKEAVKSFESQKKDENSGLSKAYEVIKQIESEIRKLSGYEKAFIIDKRGNTLLEKKGESTSVQFTNEERALFKDNILTHNHPRGWAAPEGSIGRIGNSFSYADVATAIINDMSEVRAVTPLMTFYMKRPATGWPPIDTFKKVYKQIELEVSDELWGRINNETATASQAESVHYHTIWKRLSKKLKIQYGKY